MKKTKALSMQSAACWATALVVLSGCSDTIDEPAGSTLPIVTTEAAATAPRTASVMRPNRSTDDVKEKAASLMRLFPGGVQVGRADVGAADAFGTSTALGARQVPRVRVD